MAKSVETSGRDEVTHLERNAPSAPSRRFACFVGDRSLKGLPVTTRPPVAGKRSELLGAMRLFPVRVFKWTVRFRRRV